MLSGKSKLCRSTILSRPEGSKPRHVEMRRDQIVQRLLYSRAGQHGTDGCIVPKNGAERQLADAAQLPRGNDAWVSATQMVGVTVLAVCRVLPGSVRLEARGVLVFRDQGTCGIEQLAAIDSPVLHLLDPSVNDRLCCFSPTRLLLLT